MNGKYKRLLSNTLILGLGTFGSKALVFLLMPLYTRYLSPSEFSSADLISQVANLLIPLACAGLCDGIFRFAMDRELDKAKVFSTGVSSILAALLAFAALSPLLGFIGYFSNYVWLIALYVVCSVLHSASAQFLRAMNRTTLFAVQGLITTALTIAFNVAFLVGFNMGVTGYVLSIVVADAVAMVFLVIYAKLYKVYKVTVFDKSIALSMLKYSIPMIPATIFWWITNVSDRYLVTFIRGEAENGLYSAAYKIPTILTLLAMIFIEAWQLSAVKDSSESKKEERAEFFSKVFEYYTGLIFIACTVLIAIAKIFTIVMFSPEFYESWRYIPTLLIATAFSALVTFMGSVYMLKKKSVMSFLTSMLGAALNIVLNLLLIPSLGAQGAAIATVASYVAVFIIRACDTRRFVAFKLHSLRLIINAVLIFLQCALMILEVRGWVIYQIIIVAGVLLLNLKPIIIGAKQILAAFFAKIKK